jgi:pimeloyl-ACP methyl ester carboxylesterase
LAFFVATPIVTAKPATKAHKDLASVQIHYHTVSIEGVDVFYREAGVKNAPVLVLLHDFPASSHMYRNLIPQLAGNYHVIAADYPGFGHSAMPEPSKFAYTFDHYDQVVDKLIQ